MTKKMMINALVAAAAAGLTSASASATALRDNYPGSACTRISGGTYTLYGGTVMNTSTASELTVMCPFAKDVETPQLGGEDGPNVTATFRVFDRHTNKNVRCELFSEFIAGASVFNDSEAEESWLGEDSAKAVTISGWIGDARSDAYSYAVCSIPRVQNDRVSHLATWQVSHSN